MGQFNVKGVDEKVLAQFREAVLRKYGKKHTVMGLEVEVALREYLEKRAHTHTQKKKSEVDDQVKAKDDNPGPKSKGAATLGNIVSVLHENEGLVAELDNNIPALNAIIRRVAGYDERTIRKYRVAVMSMYNHGILDSVNNGGNAKELCSLSMGKM